MPHLLLTSQPVGRSVRAKLALTGAALALAITTAASGQEISVASATDNVASAYTLPQSLPEAPGSSALAEPLAATSSSVNPAAAPSAVSDDDAAGQHAPPPMAGRFDKYIAPGQPVPKITAGDKFVLGVRDAVSLFSFTAWVVDAGYEQLVDASPNYGHNSVAFGQRFGAGVARDITQGVLGDSILAPLFHQDPRYYKMGPGHNPLVRIVYAGSRALITKTDGGRLSPNFSQVLGNLGGAVLTKTYYPQQNRTFNQITETFAGSVGGSALGFVVSEFMSDVLVALHFQHPR